MVRREVVETKTGRVRAWLNDAEAGLLGPLDRFLADPKSRDLSLFMRQFLVAVISASGAST